MSLPVSTEKGFVIFSIFGRGDWLAWELAGQGQSVQLVDLSSVVGECAFEDVEGPFGFFKPSRMKESQKRCLDLDATEEEVENGFTVWLPDGPIELRGPLANYRLKEKGVSEDLQEFLSGRERLLKSLGLNEDSEKEKIKKWSYDENWLFRLSSFWASTTESAVDDWDVESISPLFSPYSLRRKDSLGQRKKTKSFEKKGIHVDSVQSIDDIEIESGKVKSIKASGKEFRAKKFIWCLSSHESLEVTEIVKDLFPQGALKPTWCWVRARLQTAESEILKVIPQKVVCIKDVYLPWSHDNFYLLEKTQEDGTIDVWCKVPWEKRIQEDYVNELEKKITGDLSEKFSSSFSVMSSFIKSNTVNHPIYSKKELEKKKAAFFKNLFFHSPEQWLTQDWLGKFSFQEGLLKKWTQKNQESSQFMRTLDSVKNHHKENQRD